MLFSFSFLDNLIKIQMTYETRAAQRPTSADPRKIFLLDGRRIPKVC